MTVFKIACVAAAAGLGLSCVHQVQTAGVYPTPPRATAMERQIANAVDAGEGDYVARALRQKMAAEPDNVAVRLELIRHFTSAGYLALALEHCRVAAARFPDSADVRLALAKALRSMKMTREAAGGLAAFLTAHPQSSPAYDSWLGIMRDELDDWTGGEAAHRAALALNGDLDYLHNNLGYNLLRQGRSSEAAFEFRQALKLRPDSEVARNNLATAMTETPREAVMQFQSISDPATAHSNLAVMLIEQGKYAEARQELDLALGYNKGHAAALSNLKLVSELDGKPAAIPVKPVSTRWGKFRTAVRKAMGG
jgi:tetratricopeptide (TPR) repeat protein